MANSYRNKGPGSKEKPAVQLTSYQLVMAICALLLLVCIVFIAGIVVQRLNEGQAMREAQANQVAPRSSSVPSALEQQPLKEGVQVSPKHVTLPQTASNQAGVAPSKPLTDIDSGAKYIPAPPPRRETTHTVSAGNKEGSTASEATKAASPPPPAPPGEPVGNKETPSASKSPLSQPVTVPDTTPVETAKVEPPAPSSEGAKTSVTSESKPASVEAMPPAAEEKPTAASAPAGTGAKGKELFTIQVASFDSGNLDRAKRFKNQVEQKTKYKVDLLPSADGKFVRAFIGRYSDRAEADKARDALKKQPDFAGCFVKSLTE